MSEQSEQNAPERCSCCTCGYTWVKGQYGGHSCAIVMGVTIANLKNSFCRAEEELAALKAQPSGVVLPEPLKAAIMRADDVLHALAGWESSSVKLAQRHGAGWLKEIDAIRRELHTQLARLNSSPVSAGDEIPLSYVSHGDGSSGCAFPTDGRALDNTNYRVKITAGGVGGVDDRAAFEAWYETTYGISLEPEFRANHFIGYVNDKANHRWTAWQARAALSAPSHGEQVLDVLPGGWTAKQTNDREGFIISSPRVNGVASHFSVFPDSKDYASCALWKMLAAAPSAGSQKEQGE